MVLMGLALVVGIVLTLWWGGARYRPWEPAPRDMPERDRIEPDPLHPTVENVVRRYGRGVIVGVVGGFWAGALVTGPAMRLIMRLLAANARDDVQGRITEMDAVIGEINLDGTIGLVVFGGILPGLLSGVIYVAIRPWLPRGRLGGLAFGALHLVVAATRLDPLRPDNPDFNIVGPGSLSVLTFGAACLLHGMAVAALVSRYSQEFPPRAATREAPLKAILPAGPPAIVMAIGFVVFVPLLAGLIVTVLVAQIRPVVRFVRSRRGCSGAPPPARRCGRPPRRHGRRSARHRRPRRRHRAGVAHMTHSAPDGRPRPADARAGDRRRRARRQPWRRWRPPLPGPRCART